MGQLQICGADRADRRRTAAMAQWASDAAAGSRDTVCRSGGCRGKSGDGAGDDFGDGQRGGAGEGTADCGFRRGTSAGTEHGTALQRLHRGSGGLFETLRDRAGGQRGKRRDRGGPKGVSHIPGGAGGVSGRRPAGGEAGSDGSSGGADRLERRPDHRGKMVVIIWRRKSSMRSRWKRNAAVVTMAVLVCAAVALNWKYSGEDAVEQAQEAGGKLLGEATLVSGQESETDAAEDETAVYTGSDYFASARLTRQQARDNAISLLQDAARQEGADSAAANEASEGIQVLAAYTLKEAQIENLVTAKGYQDCVAFMGDDSISVVVSTGTGELTGEDVAKITDIAMSETGLEAGGIKIMAAN